MTEGGLALIAGPILGGVALGALLGPHLVRVWAGEPTVLDPFLAPVEQTLYRVFRIDPKRRQDWMRYALGLLTLNAVAFVGLYAWVRLRGAGGPSPDAAFWYAWASLTEFGTYPGAAAGSFGEPARLAGGFVAGSSGLAVAAALTRALARLRGPLIGNVWSDVVRNGLYVLFPIFALVVIALAAAAAIAPAAAWAKLAIVALGVNATRFACAFAFGRLVRARSEGYALAFIMALITGLVAWLQDAAAQAPSSAPVLGDGTALFSRLVLDSLQGGAGPGFASLLVVALLAGCLGGLLVGRTPEYLGKRLSAREVMLVTLASLVLWAAILAVAAAASVLSETLRRRVGEGIWGGSYGAAYGRVAAAVVMALGRFGALIPILAIAGALAAKPRRAETAGTAGTGSLLFLGLLIAIALIFIAVRLMPALVQIGSSPHGRLSAAGLQASWRE